MTKEVYAECQDCHNKFNMVSLDNKCPVCGGNCVWIMKKHFDIDKRIEHYNQTLECLKGIKLEET